MTPERPAAKGYRYGLSALLTLYLLSQSIRAKYEKDWTFSYEPVPIEQGIPIITLASGLLIPQSTKLARKLGKALSETESEDE